MGVISEQEEKTSRPPEVCVSSLCGVKGSYGQRPNVPEVVSGLRV